MRLKVREELKEIWFAIYKSAKAIALFNYAATSATETELASLEQLFQQNG